MQLYSGTTQTDSSFWAAASEAVELGQSSRKWPAVCTPDHARGVP